MGLLVIASNAEAYLLKVKINEKILVLEKESQEIQRFPVAVPASSNPYPLPIFGEVKKIEFNPTWYPTAKTRTAYLKKKKILLPTIVKPGDPHNAMGKVKFIIEFKNLKMPIRLHGTNNPNSIGKKITRNCIRMYNEDALELAELIKDFLPVKIIFEK